MSSSEQRCWDTWLKDEKNPAAILRAKELFETHGENKGYLEIFTPAELVVYKDFCQSMSFLKGKRLTPLAHREIRYILSREIAKDSVEIRIYNKVIAYGKVCHYKAILD